MKREFGVEAKCWQAAGRLSRNDHAACSRQRDLTRSRQAVVVQFMGMSELEIEPAPGEGFVFENKITGGAIPKEYIKPVEHGIKRRDGARISNT